MKKKVFYCLSGFFAGILNGLLGAGGGMVLVPMLEKIGMPTKHAHSNSVAVILAICICSSAIYLKNNSVSLDISLPYMLWGTVGAILGAFLLTKIKDVWIKRVFGVLMIWAAIRMLLR